MPSRFSPCRSGLSLLEVVLTLAAILLLLALLVPALPHHGREPSRKSHCQDHLHNIVVALHNYENNHKSLPPGWVEQSPQRANWSWGAALLPYLEQQPLYKQAGIDEGQQLAAALGRPDFASSVCRTAVDVFTCPTNSQQPQPNDRLPLLDSAGNEHLAAAANYVGNFGPRWNADLTQPPAGVFGRDIPTRFSDIHDGTSYSVFIGERAWVLPGQTTWYGRSVIPEVPCDAAVYLGVGGDGRVTWPHYTLGVGTSGINSRAIDAAGQPGCRTGFSSPHPGGAQVGMGDGKVTYLSESIDRAVLDALLTKDGNETARVP